MRLDTVRPKSSDPILFSKLLHKMVHYLLDMYYYFSWIFLKNTKRKTLLHAKVYMIIRQIQSYHYIFVYAIKKYFIKRFFFVFINGWYETLGCKKDVIYIRVIFRYVTWFLHHMVSMVYNAH